MKDNGKELTIEVEGIMGSHEWLIRLKPKSLNGQKGWDFWSYSTVWNEKLDKNEERWVKKTRGNKYLKGETLQDAINNLLTCGDYTLSKTLINTKDI